MDADTQAASLSPLATQELGKCTGGPVDCFFGIVKQSGGHILLYSDRGRGPPQSLLAEGGMKSLQSAGGESPRQLASMVGGNDSSSKTNDMVRDLLGRLYNRTATQFLVSARRGTLEALKTAYRFDQPMVTDVVMPGIPEKAKRTLSLLRPEIRLYILGVHNTP